MERKSVFPVPSVLGNLDSDSKGNMFDLIDRLLKILSSHEWVTLGFALFTTQSWAITTVGGKAQLVRPVYIHLLNQLHQV